MCARAELAGHSGCVVTLTFGQLDGDHIAFGPLVVQPEDRSGRRVDFVSGPIELWLGGECKSRLTGRNGIEALALRHLRDALGALRRTGRGSAYFGDHDYFQLVELEGRPDGSVAVQANVPSEDLWDVVLEPMTREDLDSLVASINELEAEVGELVGYCTACGIPPANYQET